MKAAASRDLSIARYTVDVVQCIRQSPVVLVSAVLGFVLAGCGVSRGVGLAARCADIMQRAFPSADIEITDTSRYDRWLEGRWGISTGSRINQSLPILNHDDVIPRLSERLSYLCSEDIKVFEAVKTLLDARDAPSIKGHNLA